MSTMHDDIPPLDRWRFDAIAHGPDKRLWGLSEIAEVLGVGRDKARRLAKRPDVPIYRPDGHAYFAFRNELHAWLRSK